MAKKILILDDETDILEAFKHALEREGYSVTAVSDGKQGLRAAQTQQFDLIVTDVVMPGMDGFHFFKEVKKLDGYHTVPVIVMTAHKSMEDSFRVFDVAEFFTKPVQLDVVLQAVERYLHPSFRRMERRNILICGSSMDVVTSMVQTLNDHGHKAEAAHDEVEFITKALNHPPDIVLIDVLLPKLLAHEVVKSLRAFSRFTELKVLVYTHFTEKELTSVDAVEQLKTAKNRCLEAGATEYIGRFSRVTFVETMRKY